ncbi:MAG: hypothetical protein ACPLW7_04130 [Minisyncoccia bacterium]
MSLKKFFTSFWGGALLVVILLIIGYFIWTAFAKGNVSLVINGSSDINSGGEADLDISIINNSNLILEDAILSINLPQGVFPLGEINRNNIELNIGEIPKKKTIHQNISLMIIGEEQTAKNIEVNLSYRPKGLTSTFIKQANKNIIISGSSFNLNVNTPQKVFIGQNFPIVVNWTNLTNKSFNQVELIAEWPTGFSLSSSNPDVSKENGLNNEWVIGAIGANGEGKINIQGNLTGQDGESKIIVFKLVVKQKDDILVLNKTENHVVLVKNPLVLNVSVNGDSDYIANLGDNLDVNITYLNNYNSSLRDLTLTVHLDGNVFDLSTLRAPKGTFSYRLQTITWMGDQVPSLYVLNPGQQDNLRFTVRLKKDWPMLSLAQKNIVLQIETNLQSKSVPEGVTYETLPQSSFINTIKLNSDFKVLVEAYYRDPPALIANSGSLPLKVDQPTDFTIHFKVMNTYNNVNNVLINTTLPVWARWTNQVAGNYGDNPPQYDESTRTVSWAIPVVNAGSGTLTKPLEAIFQIRITPSSSQANSSIVLINETTVTGTDTFTGQTINLTYPSILSTNLTDKTVLPSDGIVRP